MANSRVIGMHPILIAVLLVHLPILDTKLVLPPSMKRNSSCAECFIPVILRTKAQNIHLICAGNSSCPSHIVNRIPGIAWTFYNEEQELEVPVVIEWQDVCILSSDNATQLLFLLETFQKCLRTKVVISTTDYEGLQTVFHRAWKLGVTDIVAALIKDNQCLVFTYFPFQDSSKCYDTSPVLLNSWRYKSKPKTNIVYFPRDKLTNLRSCDFQIEADCLLDSNKPVLQVLRGVLVLIPFLQTTMNFKPRLVQTASDTFPTGSDNRSAMIIGPFFYGTRRLKEFIPSPIFWIFHKGLCVPQRKTYAVEWFRIFNEFSPVVWCGLMICLALKVFYTHLILFQKSRDMVSVILRTWQELLNTGTPLKNVTRFHDKVFLFLWLFFCLSLNTMYQSNLESNLVVPFTGDATNNLEDFLASELQIYTTPILYNVTLVDMFSGPEYDPLRQRVTVVNTKAEVLYDHFAGKGAFFCTVEFIRPYFPNHTYRAVPGLGFEMYMNFLLLPKKSPFEREFIRAVMECFDAGVFAYMKRIFRPRHRENGTVFKAIPLKSLSAVFAAWIVGCSLALVTFLAELSSA